MRNSKNLKPVQVLTYSDKQIDTKKPWATTDPFSEQKVT